MSLLKPMQKVVLVDFDGVALRNKTADVQVAKRASIYTWRKINNVKTYNNQMISPKHAEDICYNLYKGYGHTLPGLKSIGIKDCSMKEYNKMVYDTIDYNKVRKDNNDFNDLRSLISYCHEFNHLIFFFTNAPYRWISNTLRDHNDILHSMYDIRKVINVNEDDEIFLKPYDIIFEKIGSYFSQENIVFIDDNIGNMKPVIHNLAWTNIVFCNAEKKINNRLYFTNDLSKVVDII